MQHIDDELMRVAMHAASRARLISRPNPWVGAVVVAADGRRFVGHTHAPGDMHAEIHALRQAGFA